MEYQELLNQLLSLAGVALTAIASYGVAKFTKYIEVKKNAISNQDSMDRQDFYIIKGLELVKSAVEATNQTMVDAIKAKSADGMLTPEEAVEAFNETRNAVLVNLSKEAKEAIKTVYGDLDSFIDMQIQSHVAKAKIEKTQPLNVINAEHIVDISDEGDTL